MEELNWFNCYSDNLKGIICDEAFCHPAKFSYGLIARIYAHLLDSGYIKEGDLVADPFAGVGVGAIVAAANGLRWIGVELETKFVELAEASFSLHREQWEKMGKPYPVILQGDSRNFSSIIREAILAVVTSPPFLGCGIGKSNTGTGNVVNRNQQCVSRNRPEHIGQGQKPSVMKYGTTDGQIGAMKEGNLEEVVDAILTSPPFSDVINRDRANEPHAQSKVDYKRGGLSQYEVYGHSAGQLGAMPEGDHAEVVQAIVTSPPFAGNTGGHGKASQEAIDSALFARHIGSMVGTYDTEHNLGNLPEGSHEEVVQAIVTSPPFEKTLDRGGTSDFHLRRSSIGPNNVMVKFPNEDYGSTDGQIGQEESETYWTSCAQVYRECWKVLKPMGCLVVVVKAFVRNKQIVDLPSQTLELLEAIGFVPLERIRAWMVSPATQKSLMPDVVPPYRKEKKSFFRRLAEAKGSPRVDFEEVLIVRKERQ